MSSIPNGFPISLKSWPSKDNDAIDLPTFFQRVNFERGGLTKFDEASLRDEIFEEEAAKSLGVEDNPSDEGEPEEEEKEKVATREELLTMLAYAESLSDDMRLLTRFQGCKPILHVRFRVYIPPNFERPPSSSERDHVAAFTR